MQDTAGIIQLLSNGNHVDSIKRVEHYFDAGLFYSGNEPSFIMPTLFHYANRCALISSRSCLPSLK